MRRALLALLAAVSISGLVLVGPTSTAAASIGQCSETSADNPHPSTAKKYVIAKSRMTCSTAQKHGYMWVSLYKCGTKPPGGSVDDRVFWLNQHCSVKENHSGGETFSISANKRVTRYAPPTGSTGFSEGGYFVNYTIFGADGSTSVRKFSAVVHL